MTRQDGIKLAGRICFTAGLVVAASNLPSFAALAVAYAGAPTAPDVATGHVVPFNNHGYVHYLTATGAWMQQYMLIAVPVALLLTFAGIGMLRWRDILFRLRMRSF